MNNCKVILLGTNGWYDTATGNTISILVDIPNSYIVLDAGNGIYKLDNYLIEDKPVYLFISHYHLDHTVGLHILPKFKIKNKLFIIGPNNAKKFFKFFIEAPFTTPLKDIKYPIEILEMPIDYQKIPFDCEILAMRHSIYCQGIRIEVSGKVITYCPDTGYCENAVKLSKNADILLTECANPSGYTNPNWPHLNPETAAQIAKEASAKKLVLVHFDAEVYDNFDKRNNAEKIAHQIFDNAVAGRDGDEFII